MAASAPTAAAATTAPPATSARVRSAFLVEWRKLTSQLVTRVLLLICVQSWWAMFELRHYQPWTFAAFAVVLLQTI